MTRLPGAPPTSWGRYMDHGNISVLEARGPDLDLANVTI